MGIDRIPDHHPFVPPVPRTRKERDRVEQPDAPGEKPPERRPQREDRPDGERHVDERV
jgi:hypothetical protein